MVGTTSGQFQQNHKIGHISVNIADRKVIFRPTKPHGPQDSDSGLEIALALIFVEIWPKE